MLMIRLQRVGRKNNPSFRIVLTDKKNSTKSGRYQEVLGHFDYRSNVDKNLKADRIKHWISQGAQPTDTVHNILVKEKVIEGAKKDVRPSVKKKAAGKEAAGEKKEAAKAEAPKEEKKEETAAPAAATPESK
jgi:small subunit ribosomal protein S16